ncbi:hypothetical protein BKA82DRAFT_4107874 [Pisolithus tinctorius]|nr:hypothetical protein BKA82DRAFT_4107874 [Pisolithus tinctorius]
MSIRYAPVPNPRTEPDANAELDAAFDDSDDEAIDESHPLRRPTPSSELNQPQWNDHLQEQSALTYDFDSPIPDYDQPPPGSPPPPTAFALPNSIGNNNGTIPTFTPNDIPRTHPSWWKRATTSLLPNYLISRFRVDVSPRGSRPVMGGGTGNDGVFNNITAKPSTSGVRVQDGDDVYIVPEDSSAIPPPSYASAQADAVPPYHTSTLLLPSSDGPLTQGNIIVDALPTGTLFAFLWNALVSTTFQFIGFVLTWVMGTTHAARYGSRAGLGITLIQWGLALRSRLDEVGSWNQPTFATAKEADEYYQDTSRYNASSIEQPNAPSGSQTDDFSWKGDVALTSPMATEWLSFFLMTAGWFLLLTSTLGFWRVKRWEKSILAPSNPSPDLPPPPLQTHARSFSEVDADTEMPWPSFLAPMMQSIGSHRWSRRRRDARGVNGGAEVQEQIVLSTDPERARRTRDFLDRERAMHEELRSMGIV